MIAFGRELTRLDPMSNLTQYGYDALGHIVAITESLGRITHYEYDANGNQTAMVDPNGQRTTYTYDPGNRLITGSYSRW